MARERIVAVGLLTQRDVGLLGPAFDRLWPVEEFERDTELFADLIEAIDAAHEQTAERPPDPQRQR